MLTSAVQADVLNFRANFDLYDDPNAHQVIVVCYTQPNQWRWGGSSKTPTAFVEFQFDVQPGETLTCAARGQNEDKSIESPNSQTASYTYPHPADVPADEPTFDSLPEVTGLALEVLQ